MDLSAFLESSEYSDAVAKEGESWGKHSEDVLYYGMPFRTDYRLRTKIQRPKCHGEHNDDPKLINIAVENELCSLIKLVLNIIVVAVKCDTINAKAANSGIFFIREIRRESLYCV